MRAWPPTGSWSPPLTPDFPSAGDRLLKLLKHRPTPRPIVLDDWQRKLYRHILELYPKGHPLAGTLRWRQVLVSVARQNGKSTIGADLALCGLVQLDPAPRVLGIATSREQARIVYGRTHYAVTHSPLLSSVLRPTESRGIVWRDGRGGYQVYPVKAHGVQGEPMTYGVADELHIMPQVMWDSVVHGQKSLPSAQLVGITTAGDNDSTLLKRLEAEAAEGRIGHFIWRAPGDELTADNVAAANPAVACGRIPAERVIADIESHPTADIRRYTLNRWVDAAEPWGDFDLLDNAPVAEPQRETIAICRGDRYTSLAIGGPLSAALLWRDEWNPDAIAEIITAAAPRRVVAIGAATRASAHALPIELTPVGDNREGVTSVAWWQALTEGRWAHDHNPIVAAQLRTSRRKTSATGWRLVGDVDAINAMIGTMTEHSDLGVLA